MSLKCRICQNTNLIEVVNLGTQSLTGVFPKNKKDFVTRGPLRIVKCVGDDCCGLVQLADSYDLNEMYGENYGYRSGLNASMVRHLNAKVEKILSIAKLQNGDLIIDIGSNDSTTLKAYPDTYRLVGIDPSGLKFKEYYPPHVELIPDFFSAALVKEKVGDKKAKVITSFSMFYDLEEPQTFMQEIEGVLDDEGIWIFEQSYMPIMLEKNSYDTVCQEHLEYYALKQIKWMCDRVGLKIVDVEFNDVNGGSFSIAVSKKCSSFPENTIQITKILDHEKEMGLDTLKPWEEFVVRMEQTKEELLGFLARCKQEGQKVLGLGASTKGNVILQYCDITEELLPLVGEVNSDKFGCFTPGTLLPIVSETDVINANPDYLLVLPWHFREFFVSNPKFKGMKLVFPLPNLEIVEC